MPDHSTVLDEIARAIGELQGSGKVKELLSEALAGGISPSEIIEKGVRKGLEDVGAKYERAEYFLSELLFAAQLVNESFEILRPKLKRGEMKSLGIIVLGTVRGDIHDIGKNIFKMIAEAEGFEVNDLGVDVEALKFADATRRTSADILALSALLTTALEQMRLTVGSLEKEPMRHSAKVLLGGNAVTKEFAKEIGADEAGLTAVEGVDICRRWMEKRRG